MADTKTLFCPTCNAQQEPSPECRRCKCDLSLLVAARQRREQLTTACLCMLAEGNAERAEQLALESWALSPHETTARLLAVAYLLQGRYQAALDVSNLKVLEST